MKQGVHGHIHAGSVAQHSTALSASQDGAARIVHDPLASGNDERIAGLTTR